MGDMAEYYDERMDHTDLLDEQWEHDCAELQKRHAHNKAQPKGAWIRCSVCERQTRKGHPAKATCSRKCLDAYHNTMNPRGLGPRHGGWKR